VYENLPVMNVYLVPIVIRNGFDIKSIVRSLIIVLNHCDVTTNETRAVKNLGFTEVSISSF